MAFNPLKHEADAFRVLLYVAAVFAVAIAITLLVQAIF